MTARQRRPGGLYLYRTGEYLRPATTYETEASITAARTDGGAGVIAVPVDHGAPPVPVVHCYVVGGMVAVDDEDPDGDSMAYLRRDPGE